MRDPNVFQVDEKELEWDLLDVDLEQLNLEDEAIAMSSALNIDSDWLYEGEKCS